MIKMTAGIHLVDNARAFRDRCSFGIGVQSLIQFGEILHVVGHRVRVDRAAQILEFFNFSIFSIIISYIYANIVKNYLLLFLQVI